MIGSCEDDIEPLGSIKCGEFLNWLRICWPLTRNSALWNLLYIMALGWSSSVKAIDADESNLYAIAVHMKALSKILKCFHTHTHTPTCTRKNTHTHTHTNTHTHAHTHTHTRTPTRAHTHTHTHTHTRARVTTDIHSVYNISSSFMWYVSQCVSTIVSGSIEMCWCVICSVVHYLALNRGLIVWVQSNHLQKCKHLFWQHRKQMSQVKGLHSKMHGRRYQFWLLSCGPRKMFSYSFELFSA